MPTCHLEADPEEPAADGTGGERAEHETDLHHRPDAHDRRQRNRATPLNRRKERADHSGWGRLAPLYRWQLALERPAIAEAAALAAPRRSDRVLDLGTGTGAFLEQLALAAEPPRLAVGIDASPAMLAHAAPLPDGWKLLRADARSLPFANGSFDVVAAAYLLHVVSADDRQTILRETGRVLSPRGRLVLVTPAEPRTLLARALVATLGWKAPSTGALAGFRPLDPRRDLEAAGFVVRAARAVEHGYRSWCVLAQNSRDHPRPPSVQHSAPSDQHVR